MSWAACATSTPDRRRWPRSWATDRSAQLVVLLTDHDQFDYDMISEAKAVFDTGRRLTGDSVEHL